MRQIGNNKFIIVFILSLFTIPFCNCNSYEVTLRKAKKEIIVKTGFSCRFRGDYLDKTTNKTNFYFSDPSTNKCMKIFDDKFNLIRTIRLDSIPYSDYIKVIQVIANDSIIISVGEPIAFIYVLNFDGRIKRTIKVKDWLKVYNNNFGIESALFTNNIYENSRFYVKYTVSRDYEKYYYTPDYNYIYKIDSMVMKSPYIASFTLDSLSPNINTYVENLYQDNYKYGYDIDEMPEYYLSNNKLFIPIFHNGKLYIFNLINKKIEKKLIISSKYTNIGFNNKKKEKENIFVSAEQMQYKFNNAGKLYSLIWDNYRQVYYFIIRHSSKEEKKFKTFSIQVYDEQFNKKGETKFDNYNKYKLSDLKVVKEGLLINSNNLDNDNYEKNVEKYTLFTINY